jgi:hypothetical protein
VIDKVLIDNVELDMFIIKIAYEYLNLQALVVIYETIQPTTILGGCIIAPLDVVVNLNENSGDENEHLKECNDIVLPLNIMKKPCLLQLVYLVVI